MRRPPGSVAPALSQMEIGFGPSRVCRVDNVMDHPGGGGGRACMHTFVRACVRENVRACMRAGEHGTGMHGPSV